MEQWVLGVFQEQLSKVGFVVNPTIGYTMCPDWIVNEAPESHIFLF
jgi:hypothetical protein